MSTILDRIIAYKKDEVAELRARPSAELERSARDAPPPRGFAAALKRSVAAGRPALIAEIKRASPSRGTIREPFVPAELAADYAAGGADCLSVLTDGPSFGGKASDLAAARAATPCPILRKDFMIDPLQVLQSRAMAADAILVILAAVDDACAAQLCATATELGMDVLAEVHDEAELERAMRLDAAMIGINNRNLRTFETQLETTERLAPRATGRFIVAESGIATAADIARLQRAGAAGFLVGESLMRASDLTGATRALLQPVA